MPSIEQYQMLVAIAESDSLRAAAKKVFKTQPTVTTAIKKMETELAISLFHRDQYRLRLTDEGKKIYQTALTLLSNHQDILTQAGHFRQGQESSIRLAIEASFSLKHILEPLTFIQKHFPDTQVILQQEYMTGAFEKLLEEQVDLAITPIAPAFFPTGEIDSKSLYLGEFVTLASPDLLAKHQPLLSVKQLRNEYQILVKDTGKRTEGKNIGVQQDQRLWWVNNFEAKLLLIKSGLGWGSLPLPIAQQALKSGQVLALELSDAPQNKHIDYRLIKRRDQKLGPVSHKLWELC